MICSVCKAEMSERDLGGVKIDVCDKCKSLWFDWLELEKLDEKNEGLGQALQDALRYPRINDENRPPLQCPKCHIPLHAHKYKDSKEINIDECYACGGMFLDSGELKPIRDNHMSETEREKYCQGLLSDLPEYRKAAAGLEKEQARANAMRHFTKFLRLSYYVTGK